MKINQYQIVLVNLEGSEITKTRPCLVISPDEINRNLKVITIAPMTSQSKPYPSRVKVKHNEKEGWVVIDQLRSIDRRRVIRELGSLSNQEIKQVKEVIRETFVD